MEELLLVEPSEEYAEQIRAYRQEFLDAGSSMDGTGPLRKIEDPYEWMASMYIEEKHMVPPVLFDDLLKMDIPADLRAAIDELLEIKKRTTEKEENPQLPVIKAFIESEIEKKKEIADSLPDDHNKDWSALDRLFLEMLGD